MIASKLKPHRCKVKTCRIEYSPVRKFQKGCCIDHEVILGLEAVEKKKRIEEKRAREDLKARKEAAKRPGELKTEAQSAFNAYIRERDLGAGFPCICCGKPFEPQKPGGSVDAGHYLSRGSAPHLRFNELNVHAQRKNCNRPGGTTRAEFREGMIARIGLAAVEALESDQTETRYRDDDYRRIKAEYRAKRLVLISKRREAA